MGRIYDMYDILSMMFFWICALDRAMELLSESMVSLFKTKLATRHVNFLTQGSLENVCFCLYELPVQIITISIVILCILKTVSCCSVLALCH